MKSPVLAVALMAVLGLTGCGGDDDSSDTAAPSPSVTAEASPTAAAADPAVCERLTAANTELANFGKAVQGGGDPLAAAKSAAPVIEASAEGAPTEVAAAATRVAVTLNESIKSGTFEIATVAAAGAELQADGKTMNDFAVSSC